MRRSWNTSQELKRVYGRDRNHFFLYHIPYVMRKSIVQDAEKQFPDLFKRVSADRFRSGDTYRITCCLAQYVGLYTDRAKACCGDYYYFPYQSDLSFDTQHMNILFERRPSFFCVQDEETTGTRADAEEALTRFFEQYFPVPAPWEK